MEIDNFVREQLQNILNKEPDTSEVPQPAKEDVREFERLLEADASQKVNAADPANAAQAAEKVAQAEQVNQTRQIESTDIPLMSREEALGDAGRLLEELESGTLSAKELNRLQYVMKVLHIQTITSTQATQQVEQGVDTVLKQ